MSRARGAARSGGAPKKLHIAGLHIAGVAIAGEGSPADSGFQCAICNSAICNAPGGVQGSPPDASKE